MENKENNEIKSEIENNKNKENINNNKQKDDPKNTELTKDNTYNIKEFEIKLNIDNNIDNKSIEEELKELRKQPLKKRTFFYKNEILVEGEDEFIEFKNYFYPLDEEQEQEIKRQYCGFLNSKGGRIYIGIKDQKMVSGIQLTYKEQDSFRNSLVGYGNEFYPKCRLDKIKVYFIPIKNSLTKKFIYNLYVVKIIIFPGDPFVLYSLTTDGFKSAKRLQGQTLNLSADEIYKEISDRVICKIKVNNILINYDDFNDPEPEKNLDAKLDITKRIVKKKINQNLINKNIQYIVVVKNIDKNLKVRDINAKFNELKCSGRRFPKNEGKTVGSGKLYFSSEENAKEAIQKFNGTNLGGKKKIIMTLRKFTFFQKSKK